MKVAAAAYAAMEAAHSDAAHAAVEPSHAAVEFVHADGSQRSRGP